MADTTRLSLPQPTGIDLISEGDNAISEGFLTLDAAVLYQEGTFAGRPSAAALDGKVYVATDVGIVYLSDGTNWIELSRGGGAVPIGGMIDYAGAGDPDDTRYLLADGRAISRTTYAALFALVGVTFGSGNGTTTFNIPDARGRQTVGPDNMGTAAGAAGRMATSNVRGATGGSETTTILETNLPAHTHGVGTLDTSTAADHTHAVGTLDMGLSGTHTHGVGTIAVAGSGILTTGAESNDHTHSGNTDSADPTGDTITWRTFNEYPGVNVANYAASAIHSDAHNHSFSTGGRSASHTHSVASHAHTLSGASAAGGDHKHSITGATAAGGTHKHTISGSTASTGSGTSFNTMNPYVVVNKIIRVS